MARRSLRRRRNTIQSPTGLQSRRSRQVKCGRRLHANIPVNQNIITWLVKHAADILNEFAVGADGRTAHDRIRRKKYYGEMVEFGRKVVYTIYCKSEGIDDGQMGSWSLAWKRALSVNRTPSHIAFTDTDTLSARHI